VVLGGELPPPPPEPADHPSSYVHKLVRMNPLVQPWEVNGEVPWGPPPGLSPDDFKRLTELQLDAVEQADVDAIRRFTKAWLEDLITNQAIRANGSSLRHEIGHPRYSEALSHWRTIDRDALAGEAWASNHQAVLSKLQP
jgi:hypothetical protein